MKRTLALAAALTVGVAAAGAASAEVVTTVAGTTIGGGTLTIAGTGAAVALSGTPGSLTSTIGATALTVSDLRGSSDGWAVTATYSNPDAGLAIGGANVLVSAGNVTPNVLGGLSAGAVTTVTDQALGTPVTVATTGTGTGSGITAVTASLKVRIPVTAQVGQVFGGKVTYTVASVR